mgnify:CR=1 FL=1
MVSKADYVECVAYLEEEYKREIREHWSTYMQFKHTYGGDKLGGETVQGEGESLSVLAREGGGGVQPREEHFGFARVRSLMRSGLSEGAERATAGCRLLDERAPAEPEALGGSARLRQVLDSHKDCSGRRWTE